MNLDELNTELMSLGNKNPEAAAPEPEVPADAMDNGAVVADEAEVTPVITLPQVEKTDYAAVGYHLNTTVNSEDVTGAALIHFENGFSIEAVTGVDWIDENELEVVYDFFHYQTLCRSVVRTRIPRNKPELSTISEVFPGANWHERETHDFFGINFIGHPDLSPFLLPDDADYHPLLKDFEYEYQRPN